MSVIENLESLTSAAAALSDPVRLRIVALLFRAADAEAASRVVAFVVKKMLVFHDALTKGE